MKKAQNGRRRAVPKGGKPKAQRGARADSAPGGGAHFVAMLQALGLGADAPFDDGGEDDLDALLDDFLVFAATADSPAGEFQDLLKDLEMALDEARIDANGGDAEARRDLQDFARRVDAAADKGQMQPVALIMLGAALRNAGLAASEALRGALGKALGGADALTQDQVPLPSIRTLFPAAKIRDPFDFYEAAAACLEGFPTGFRVAMARPLAAEADSTARLAALGFAFHADEALSCAVLEAFAAPLAARPSDELVAARLRRIAPWLPPRRRALAEAAARSMRPAPVQVPAPRQEEELAIYASTCDGSGTSSLMVTQMRGSRLWMAHLLMKPAGVADVLLRFQMPRAEVDENKAKMRRATPGADVGMPCFVRLLRLALGRNLASGALPPFRLTHICETLGLGELAPDLSTTAQIVAQLLVETPGGEDEDALAAAHRAIAGHALAESWFDADAAVYSLLTPCKTPKQAKAALMAKYLPGRREFWARQCALCAVALRDKGGPGRETWRHLALIGREIAGEAALETIPLIGQIADRSVEAHFAQRMR